MAVKFYNTLYREFSTPAIKIEMARDSRDKSISRNYVHPDYKQFTLYKTVANPLGDSKYTVEFWFEFFGKPNDTANFRIQEFRFENGFRYNPSVANRLDQAGLLILQFDQGEISQMPTKNSQSFDIHMEDTNSGELFVIRVLNGLNVVEAY